MSQVLLRIGACRALTPPLIFHPALVRAGDLQIFTIFRDRSASYLNALRLQDLGDLVVRQRMGGIFLLDQFLHAALQNEQRRPAAFGAIDALAEEIAQFEDALRS